jgi:hypothetical protein
MALEMRERCEKCSAALGLGADAFICRDECTFCPAVVRRLHEIWNTAAEEFVGHFPPSSHLPERRGRAGAREGITRARVAEQWCLLDDLGRLQPLSRWRT